MQSAARNRNETVKKSTTTPESVLVVSNDKRSGAVQIDDRLAAAFNIVSRHVRRGEAAARPASHCLQDMIQS